MTGVRLVCAAAVLLALPALAGCESTQSKSAKIEAQARENLNVDGLKIKEQNSDIEIVEAVVLDDGAGSGAVVVRLQNTSGRGFAHLPISVNVLDKKGKSVYRNDEAGLEGYLWQVPLVAAGETVDWVSDGLPLEGEAAEVKVKVGFSSEPYPTDLPRLGLGEPTLESDEDLGTSATGKLVNQSGERQTEIAIYAVARKGGEVTAAGTAVVRKLNPDQKKPAEYNIFFIGDPGDGELKVVAHPTVFAGGKT